MTARTDSALASLLLTNRLVDVPAEPLRSRDYWQLLDRIADPGALLGGDAAAIASTHGLEPELAGRLGTLLSAGTAVALTLDELERQGVRAISPFDEAYPGVLRDRLEHRAPPVLYAAGPSSLLSGGGLAIVGSRNVSDAGAEVAKEAARHAAQRGMTVISGGAKGTDQLAMNAAHHSGSPTVGVLAESLLRKLEQPDVRRAIQEELACLVSPYKPTAGFSVANAMGRNKIIYALASTAFVVAADDGSGGTWQGAVEALRGKFATVTVWMGEGAGPGNEQLVAHGAAPVNTVDEIFAERSQPAPSSATQLRLA
jgi:predicted Rossmann fold nucleotide-binding protein DprA/Smf involved in DNA uptake